MSRSWIGRGWEHQARMRKAKRNHAKRLEWMDRPVTSDDLARDASRRFRARNKHD